MQMSEIWTGQWVGPRGPATLDTHAAAIRAGQSCALFGCLGNSR